MKSKNMFVLGLTLALSPLVAVQARADEEFAVGSKFVVTNLPNTSAKDVYFQDGRFKQRVDLDTDRSHAQMRLLDYKNEEAGGDLWVDMSQVESKLPKGTEMTIHSATYVTTDGSGQKHWSITLNGPNNLQILVFGVGPTMTDAMKEVRNSLEFAKDDEALTQIQLRIAIANAEKVAERIGETNPERRTLVSQALDNLRKAAEAGTTPSSGSGSTSGAQEGR